jgi:hypothetical protein
MLTETELCEQSWAAYWAVDEEGDYLQQVSEIAEGFGVCADTLYNVWKRNGKKKRRADVRNVVRRGADRLLSEACEGYVEGFCGYCPVMPTCTDWRCTKCWWDHKCPCLHKRKRPWKWKEDFNKWMKMKARNKRALDVYEYAHCDVGKALEAVPDG